MILIYLSNIYWGKLMGVWANLGRVAASDDVLPILDSQLSGERPSYLILVTSADLHWRKQEWDLAIIASMRALKISRNDFHMLTILATSLVNAGQTAAALPYAKRMLEVKPPNWIAARALAAALRFHMLILPGRKKEFFQTQRRIDREAMSDRDHLMWAQDFVAKIGATGEHTPA